MLDGSFLEARSKTAKSSALYRHGILVRVVDRIVSLISFIMAKSSILFTVSTLHLALLLSIHLAFHNPYPRFQCITTGRTG